MEQWAAGQFQSESMNATAMLNIGAQAKVQILDDILEMDYEELKGVLEGEE